MSGTFQILIADPHEIVRLGFISIIGRMHPEWKIVGEATGGRQAIEMAESLRPNIAIVDLEITDPDGLKVVQRLRTAAPGINVLAVSSHMALPVLKKARRAGASGLLSKNEPAERFVEGIESMISSRAFFASPQARRDLSQLGREEYIPIKYLLSDRELEVLRLMAKGLSRKRVARELGISVRTADAHRNGIFARSPVKSLSQAVRLAVLERLI